MLGRLRRFQQLKVPLTKRFLAMGAEQSNILGDHKFPVSNCRIVVVGPKSGAPALAELANLPQDARILATGANVEELRKDGELFTEANVLLFYSGNAEILTDIINEMPFLTWIHTIFAGLDNIMCPALSDNDDITLTNAKGVFSSSLAEYVLGACWYFAKDIPRMKEQQENKIWNQFAVTEMKGQTMGIVGYGNIGYHVAKLAKAFGMKVVALRKNPDYSSNDRLVDMVYGMNELDTVMEQCDYVVSILPNTPQTKHFIKGKHFKKAKKGQIFINIGRGATVDETALVNALKEGSIAGAALDVFTVEPLPETSELWTMPNVLISSHNADILVDSREQSVRLFNELCKKFLAGEELDCIVDKKAGY